MSEIIYTVGKEIEVSNNLIKQLHNHVRQQDDLNLQAYLVIHTIPDNNY